ncbi:MAG: hypothetical protein M3P12_02660 [Gemmatimonadota bacterium]|nr:hypothetical protein [Gemmatimonadota bacterium]
MRIRHVVAVSSLSIALPLASVSGQSAAPEPPKWSLSFGVDPTNFDLHTSDPGVDARIVANLTRSWQTANSRLARQISLMVGTDAPRQVNPSPDPQCVCWQKITRRYTGLTAGLSYELFSASRFTPYLKGGTGAYYSTRHIWPASGALRVTDFVYYPNGFVQSGFSLGVNGGFGIKARLGSHELFIEQMLHSFDVRQLDKGVYPLNIGIRF